MGKKLEVQLVNYQGYIHKKVVAGIDEEGRLYLDGYDSGDLPPSDIYDDDVEYSLCISADQKEKVRDILILALQGVNRQVPENLQINNGDDAQLLESLDYHYQGEYNAFSDFKTLLEKNEIKFIFNWG